MKSEVELIYDPACPHVSAARSALLKAFAIAGRRARWTEWRTDSPEIPDRLCLLGSPTILVHGRDVATAVANPTGPCCRLYGDASSTAPTPDEIAGKLNTGTSTGMSTIASAAAAVAAFLLPFGLCPACWPAHGAVLGSLGAGFLLETTYQAPIAIGLFALAIASHSFQARRSGRYVALLPAFAGASLALAGKFILLKAAVQYAGLFVFVLSAVWVAMVGGRQTHANGRNSFSNQNLEICHECKKNN